jgi:hypothetical protein
MKNKKGNNFVKEEEKQLCCNFFHVSQDPTTGTDLRSIAFWDQIHEHYNQNQHVLRVSDLPNFLIQNGESLNMMLSNLLGTTEQWWHFVNLGF